ncbi:MAG: hypothetical protein EOO03_01335 [Chitinophagaceae bacterium]|nr:MAG: hypothetical protein EOO03_01335 [Chitinophagaceae bacterium]
MNRINPDIDIIADLLKAVLQARPDDAFCSSLLHQYQERGGLSKKQLEGLLGKASKFTDAPPGKLATLEAIILKKHTNHRSVVTTPTPQEQEADDSPQKIEAILQKYPGHKRVLFFKMKADKREPLSVVEKTELDKFAKLLLKP